MAIAFASAIAVPLPPMRLIAARNEEIRAGRRHQGDRDVIFTHAFGELITVHAMPRDRHIGRSADQRLSRGAAALNPADSS